MFFINFYYKLIKNLFATEHCIYVFNLNQEIKAFDEP